MSRITSSLKPGGTVSDSMSVTKPYLYGWSTWASIPLLIGSEHRLRAVPGRGRAGRELGEQGPIPDHWVPAPLGEARHDGGRAGAAVRLEQALEGGDAHVRQIHRPRHDPRGARRLEGGE